MYVKMLSTPLSILLGLIMALVSPTLAISGRITGLVTSTNGEPLAGVNVTVQGTMYGAATDTNGYYHVPDIEAGDYTLVASRIGYAQEAKKIHVRGVVRVDFVLKELILQLSEVTVAGTFVTENRAPVTFTSLSEKDIGRRYTIQDVPLILKEMPSVYTTTDGGWGLGDSRILIRGFDEKRIQVLVNNIPINDPESKDVAWANWGMLSAIAQNVQIQRGVGTSLYGSGALGGSIQIMTKDAPTARGNRIVASIGQYGIRKITLVHNSGLLKGNKAFMATIGFLNGNGWRTNTFYRRLNYYFSATFLRSPRNTFKLVLYGAPQYHALSYYSFDAAAYGSPGQLTRKSHIAGGTGKKNGFGQYAYGFGSDFNGNVHVRKDELPSGELKRVTTLWDALFMRARIGASPEERTGGWIVANGRASLDNNVSHRPQFEIHHSLKIGKYGKTTSTFFLTKGLDYSDNVFPFYYIPRDSTGSISYKVIKDGNYYGGNEVFQYRYYSDFFQTGFLSSFETTYMNHEFSAGIEMRFWRSRHAGEMLNTFGRGQIGIKVGSVQQMFSEGDLFYDFDTKKPQATLFGRALWHFKSVDVMTNLQISTMKYRILERVPSNNNYPNHLDSTASSTHGGKIWVGTATWNHDGDPSTPDQPVTYTLWDYFRTYHYATPRIGISYDVSQQLNVMANWSIGVKEPRVKHFFGYGSPREEIELEKTNDIELALRFDDRVMELPINFHLYWYRIKFEGKLMQITVPEKANTPGYDYAGHYSVSIGAATYTGSELELDMGLPMGFRFTLNGSKSSNTWGEPTGSEGAQKLYANEAVAGVDYYDADGDGVWDEGGEEYALHRNFVKDYGPRHEVGFPQLVGAAALRWQNGPLAIASSVRYHQDIYVLEDNGKIRIGAGSDNIFGTEDDRFSPVLPPATIVDLRVEYSLAFDSRKLNLALHINNLLDTRFWQRGDEYGLAPGPPRMILISTRLEM